MGQSVEELRLESERNRAALATTVDQLRERLFDTAEDLRYKASPQHIKSEVSDYINHKTQSWLGGLKQQAMDNPLQAIAAGTAIAVPVLRLARGLPLPLLMMCAGLALSSKTVRGRAAEAATPALDAAGEMLNEAAESAQGLRGNVKSSISSAQSQSTDFTNKAEGRVADLVGDLGSRAAEIGSTVTDKLKDGMDTAKDTIERARSTAKDQVGAARDAVATAPAKARQVIGDNAALIGGLGIAIGAIIAAALPRTEAEDKIVGGASDSVKHTAKTATQSGFEAAKDATISAAEAATKSVDETNLGAHASRMTRNLAGTVKEAAEDVVTAAFDPESRTTPGKRSS
jgi:gas vesicle protein